MHPTGDDDALRIQFLKELGCSVGHGKRIAPHIHEEYLISLEAFTHLTPGGRAAGGVQLGHHAVLMENCSEEAQPMILPLLVRTTRVNQISQITQVQP
jgi:hypothetical protein